MHYVRASESRKKQFFQCVEQVGGIDTSIGLRSDCVTRWNSTYTMLESAINYCRAFQSLSLIDKIIIGVHLIMNGLDKFQCVNS